MKVLTLIGSACRDRHVGGLSASAEKFERFEYPVLILLATLGMMMMISANDLIPLYLGLELQSLALYVVAAINRDNRPARPRRASNISSSARCPRACSSTAPRWSTASPARRPSPRSPRRFRPASASIGLVFGLVFLIAGLAFKVSAVPFHMWTPDVYEGAPTPVTAFFAAAPKMAAMALFVRAIVVRLRADPDRLAADHHLHRHRLDGARRLRRHRPAEHQAPDGLFLDRPHGLRAGRPRRRQRRPACRA